MSKAKYHISEDDSLKNKCNGATGGKLAYDLSDVTCPECKAIQNPKILKVKPRRSKGSKVSPRIHAHYCLRCEKDFRCYRKSEDCSYYRESVCNKCFIKICESLYDGPDNKDTRRVASFPKVLGSYE